MPTGGSWSPVTEQRIVVREVEIHRWPWKEGWGVTKVKGQGWKEIGARQDHSQIVGPGWLQCQGQGRNEGAAGGAVCTRERAHMGGGVHVRVQHGCACVFTCVLYGMCVCEFYVHVCVCLCSFV
jgi:hypothetical protein